MPGDEPVTSWLRQLEAGDENAARLLWQRYFHELEVLARARFGATPRRVFDEEDVALSVMRCLYEGAARGQYSDLANRHELWRLLAIITGRKVIAKQRLVSQQKRGGGSSPRRFRAQWEQWWTFGRRVRSIPKRCRLAGSAGNRSRRIPPPDVVA